jgi:hypothetical protein
MKPLRSLLISGVLVLTTMTAACGGSGSEAREVERATQLDYLARGLLRHEQRVAADARVEAHQRCNSNLGGLIDALSQLDSRLDIGLNFQSYSDRVGDAQVAYDRMDISSLAYGGCLSAGVSAEKALNAYSRAYNTWNDCIGEFDCDTDSIEPDLQLDWVKASNHVEAARRKLENLKSAGGPRVGGWTRTIPVTAEQVPNTIYGATSKGLCGVDAPIAAVEPCRLLRTAVEGGVEEREIGDLDEAIEELNRAYLFAPVE